MLKRVLVAGVALAAVLSWCETSHAQMFFDAEWMYYGRDNDSRGNVVNGPQPIGLGGGDFGMTSGYRLTLGGSLPYLDIDASFMQLDTFNDSSSGFFQDSILLDGGTDLENPADFNQFAAFTALSRAASYRDFGAMIDETLESERLIVPDEVPMSYIDEFGAETFTAPMYTTFNESNFREFEVNIGTNRNSSWWRFAVGYRHIKVDERSGVTVGGFFDALDTNDGNPFDGTMADDLNGGLSDEALSEAGLTLLAGSGGFTAIDLQDPMALVPPDYLTYGIFGNAANELNGAQATFVGRVFDGTWVTIEAIGKAGIYSNKSQASVTEVVVGGGNSDSAYARTFAGGDNTAAFAGNLGFRSTISLTDYINIITGYQVIFLNGIALGADQIHGLSDDIFGDTRYEVQHDGSIVLYGGNLGLELLW